MGETTPRPARAAAPKHLAPAGPQAESAAWFFENARELFGVVSREGRLLAVNPAWETVTGWSAAELIGRNLLEILHEDSRGAVRDLGRTVNRDGYVATRMRAVCKDGRSVWLEGHARSGPNGEMMGMLRDVTDERRRAEELRRAEQAQSLLSETAGVGLWRYDPRNQSLEWSAEWEAMLSDAGVSMATADEFAAVCHPDDLANVFALVERTAETGAPGAFTHRFRAADGRWIWVRVHIRGEEIAEGVRIVHGISQDVTELREALAAVTEARREGEARMGRLKIALSAARAAVVEIDYESRSAWTSPGFEALVGRGLAYEEARRAVWPFIHAEDVGLVETAVRGWLKGELPTPLEVRVTSSGGQPRWVRIYTEIERNGAGRFRRSVSLLMDVDERHRQEQALIEAERLANSAADAKAQFLANMSHEIRTPMNGVLGVLHLLKSQPLPAGAHGLLSEALACGAMLQALLDDVVDFSRIEAGRLELAQDPADPRAVAEGVVKLLRPQAEDKGLTLVLEAAGLPAWVLADDVRLRQCLFNLIGNAVKFTGEGGVTVRAIALGSGPEGRLRFEVEDTGIGISAEAQARLFQRFQQADASTTRRFGGSGLGLAITSRLAELMGGEVGVRSAEGRGSCFWFEIAAPETAPPATVAAQGLSVLEGLRCLVVEDNATNRMIATRMLEELGA